MNLKEYISQDATGLASLLKKGEIKSEELIGLAIKVIDLQNPDINAVIQDYQELALEQVKKQQIPEGPFKGVPILIKDMLNLEGTVAAYGSRLLKLNKCHDTHEVLKRLFQGGFINLGRTNMSEMGFTPTTEPELYGSCNNPWNLKHSPGGSSGGSGAAVAAGMVPLAYASDGGGSIRIPASACGLFGLKPSRGRNPMDLEDHTEGILVHHIISRSVRDSAAVLDLTQGSRAGDRWVLPAPSKPYTELIKKKPRKLRIAVSRTDFSGRMADKDNQLAIDHTINLLKSCGHEILEISPDIDPDSFQEAFKRIWAISAGYVLRLVQKNFNKMENLPQFVKEALKNRGFFQFMLNLKNPFTGAQLMEKMTLKLAAMEQNYSASEHWMHMDILQEAHYIFGEFLERHDLFLCPVLGSAPWPTGYIDFDWDPDFIQEELYRYAGFTPLGNSSGFPAMSVPLYINSDNLPIGVQFYSGLGKDGLLLQLAAQLENLQPWLNRLPEKTLQLYKYK
jgi:amidase